MKLKLRAGLSLIQTRDRRFLSHMMLASRAGRVRGGRNLREKTSFSTRGRNTERRVESLLFVFYGG
jgi:hypothetical protein